MLSKEETQEILKYNSVFDYFFKVVTINKKQSPFFAGETIPCLRWPEESLMVDHKLRCTKDKVGLLSKIVDVIKQEPSTASFRYSFKRKNF
jgi:hypothetical protein